MNIGYYKLAKYMGTKCHNDLTFYFTDRLKDGWTYKSAHAVADLYVRTDDGWQIEIDGKTYRVLETDRRRRIPIEVHGVTDKLSAQVDQVIFCGKKYLLDWKFTKCDDELERIIDEARQQIAYYAWIVADPDVAGGAYIVSSLKTKEVLAVGAFDFEPHEMERALMRRLTELPGYENLHYGDIRRAS